MRKLFPAKEKNGGHVNEGQTLINVNGGQTLINVNGDRPCLKKGQT